MALPEIWGDLVALAKAGYKPADVKDLISLASVNTENPKDNTAPKEETKPEENKNTPPEDKKPEAESIFEQLAKKE